MREYEKYEIVKTKCSVCGCKNKVHTELLDNKNTFVGYSLKCCACGHINTFYLDMEKNGTKEPRRYFQGKETCMMSSYCPRRNECKLYTNSDDEPIKNVCDDPYYIPPIKPINQVSQTISISVSDGKRFL